MATKKTTDELDTMRKQHERAKDYWSKKFDMSRDDIKFVAVPGNQWDEKLKARRGNRPTYEFPKLPMQIKQVINEMRQARPQGKVRGTEESDRGLAEIMQGLCRNIESVSNAEQAYDIAFEPAVQGGYGVWRVCTDYASDDDFEQDIRIKAIRNPFSALCDPAAVEIDRRDANFWFVEELIPEEQFKAEHPKADFDGLWADVNCGKWRERGQVLRAEYWYKKPIDRELWAVESANGPATIFPDEYPDFTEADFIAAGLQITQRRTVKSHKVYMRLTNGYEWLSEPYEFPSKFIPIVVLWGNIQNIDGDDHFCGMVRSAKDQQRLHNVHRTALVEAVAKAPKAPFITKPKWIKGFETMWNGANAEDRPVLYINDEAPDGAIPARTEQAQVPTALIQLAAMDNDDMKAATGQYDASLGARSNETSGVAINSRKQQGATATFNFIDNLTYAIRYQYEILIDMIPRIYDTRRTVRILGEDGGAKWKELYQEVQDPETGQMITLNDISKGKYDVTVTVGPAYATQRMEAVEAFSQLAGQIGGSFPAIGPLLAYQVVKNLDLPGSEEVDKALRRGLVQANILPPEEGDEAPQQNAPPPNPKDVASAENQKAQAALNQAKAIAQQLENAMNAAQAAAMGLQPPPMDMQGPPDQMPPDDMGQMGAPPQGMPPDEPEPAFMG